MSIIHRVAAPTQDSYGGRTPLGLRAEHRAKDYSQASSFHVVCPIRFWTDMGPVNAFFFPTSPLGNGNTYSMSVALLYFGSTELVWFHTFTARENLPQDEPYLGYPY